MPGTVLAGEGTAENLVQMPPCVERCVYSPIIQRSLQEARAASHSAGPQPLFVESKSDCAAFLASLFSLFLLWLYSLSQVQKQEIEFHNYKISG